MIDVLGQTIENEHICGQAREHSGRRPHHMCNAIALPDLANDISVVTDPDRLNRRLLIAVDVLEQSGGVVG